jgi:hypothetical protein
MPNGSELRYLEYRKHQELFEPVDSVLAKFAKEVGAKVERQHHGYPCRLIVSNGDPVREVGITVIVAGRTPLKPSFSVGYLARKSVGALSYAWVGRSVILARFPDEQKFYDLLWRLWHKLESLSTEDLKLVKKQRV